MSFKHGHAGKWRNHGESREYRIWMNMRSRCKYPSHSMYSYYGGRGIAVCDRWATDFVAFLADMGPAPTQQHTIDRIDTNGNYEPGNCRWATRKEQSRNSRRSSTLTLNGETRRICEWSEITGLSQQAICNRLARGWPVDRTLMEAANGRVLER